MKTTTIFLAVFLAGCGLIPKRVELGQDRVKKFPEHPKAQLEAERQAVALAAEKAREAEKIATADQSQAALPASESAELSESVGRSLGPPANPWSGEVTALTERLDKLTAKYNGLLATFKQGNDALAGKKIEGTGIFQVPYFLWLGIVGAVMFVVWIVLRAVVSIAAAGNPGVAVGLKVAQVGGRTLSRGFSQLVSGGEHFKDWLKKEVPDEGLKTKILEAFRQNQVCEQDKDVQSLIKELTNK